MLNCICTKTNNIMTTLTKKPSLLPDVPSFMSDFWDDDIWTNRFFGTQQKLPAANIIEREKEFTVELAIPGMTKKDFKINVENGTLKVSCEKRDENLEKKEAYTRKEFSYSSFARTFTLPETVNTEKINAHYEDGILKFTLPKKEMVGKQTKRLITVD